MKMFHEDSDLDECKAEDSDLDKSEAEEYTQKDIQERDRDISNDEDLCNRNDAGSFSNNNSDDTSAY